MQNLRRTATTPRSISRFERPAAQEEERPGQSMRWMAALLALVLAFALAFAVPQAQAQSTIEVDTNDDEVNSDGDCALREAVQAANTNSAVDDCTAGSDDGDEIVFSASFLLEQDFPLSMGQLTIEDDVTIDGSGAISTPTIDAQDDSRVFNVDVGDSPGSVDAVEFANLVITDGNSSSESLDAGGGVDIKSDENVTFTNVDVTGNVAGINGGGIHAAGGATLTITAENFNTVDIRNNEAQGGSAGNGGGGIWGAGPVTIGGGGSIFISNNSATGSAGSGGGVLNFGSTLDIDGATIRGNTANRAGGGIENFDGDGDGNHTVTLTGVTLDQNDVSTNAAPGNGGGLHSGGGDVTVNGGDVTSNTAVEGGGLWTSGTLTVQASASDSTLIDANEATGDDTDGDGTPDDGGGGVYNEGGTVTIAGGAQITGNTASGSAGSGGGILNFGGTLTVTDGAISGNTANRAGGGLEDNAADSDTDVTLTGVTFDGNTIGTPAPGNGGALHSGGGTVLIRNSKFTSNVAVEGGALWTSGTLTLDNIEGVDQSGTSIGSFFGPNEATGDAADQGGGGIYSQGGTVDMFAAAIQFNEATGASGSGGGLLNNGGTVTIDTSGIGVNTANRAGAGIETAGGSVTMRGAFIFQNEIDSANPGNGGGLHAGGDADVTVQRTTVAQNIAAEGGGLWAGGSSTFDVTLSTVSENETTSSGGGGIYDDGGADVSVTSSTVADNIASGDGGGFFAGGSNFSFGNTIVGDNFANGDSMDVSGTFSSNDYNLIENPGSATINGDTGNNVTGQDPLLMELSGYGGPTPTQQLRPNSPAGDAGSNLSGASTDQRGEQRPFDDPDPENVADATDIGSVERSDGGLIPVELASFTAQAEERAAVLSWRTLTETNNAGFRVERQTADGGWTAASPLIEGAGTTSEPQDYSYRVEDLDFGAHTFRLRQIDRGAAGQIVGEPVDVEVSMQSAYSLEPAYPNPFQQRATLKFSVRERQPVTVALYNTLGQRVRVLYDRAPAAGRTQTLTLRASDLASGFYFVRLVGEDFTTTQSITLVR